MVWPALLNMKMLWRAAVQEDDCEEGDPAYAVCRHVVRVITDVCDACYRFLTALPSVDPENAAREAALHESKVAMMSFLLECAGHCEHGISSLTLDYLSNLTEDMTELYFNYRDAVDAGYSPDSSESSSTSPSPRGTQGHGDGDGDEDQAIWSHCWSLSLVLNLSVCRRRGFLLFLFLYY